MTLSVEISEDGGFQPPKSLYSLQSKDHGAVLDIIDQLRSEGISRYVDLPQLIVCGDQSAGKSSVLEAISGYDFPRADNLCTRFATELILRRAPEAGISVSIYPDTDRPKEEQKRLKDFKTTGIKKDGFADVVKAAGIAMGVGENDNPPFSKDILRIEISGPTQPHLTLVDLPGLYHAAVESQNAAGITLVKSLVQSYMKNPRSVILAVISAQSDAVLQKVTAYTRKVDPDGIRTLGIITKPDTLPASSETERSFHLLAQNQKVNFRLGWHVLKNRTFEQRNYSIEDRHKSEEMFLSQGIWKSLSRSQLGIHTLVSRLSTILNDHIVLQAPSFLADAQKSISETKSRLQKLGPARKTLSEQRRYLMDGSERFTDLINYSLRGIYLDAYFRKQFDDNADKRCLRAVVQGRLSNFADAMRDRGEYTKIIEDGTDRESTSNCRYRSEFVEEVRKKIRRNRGQELPGNFSPFIIGELFYEQAQLWEELVSQYMEKLLDDVHDAILLALQEVLDQHSIQELFRRIVKQRLSELDDNLHAKTAELLEPHKAGHPITYNPQYIEHIQGIRTRHLRETMVSRLKIFFGDKYPMNLNIDRSFTFRMQELIDSVSSQTEDDMERFACSEAIDCMQAYYRVAMTKFVDDFSTLSVEKCLLKPLLNIFSPRTVMEMTEEIVEEIASEDEKTATERRGLESKLTILGNSMKSLQQLEKYSLRGLRTVYREENEAENEVDPANNEADQIRAKTDPISTPPPASIENNLGTEQTEVVLNLESVTGADEIEELVLPWPTKKDRKKKKRNTEPDLRDIEYDQPEQPPDSDLSY